MKRIESSEAQKHKAPERESVSEFFLVVGCNDESAEDKEVIHEKESILHKRDSLDPGMVPATISLVVYDGETLVKSCDL